MKNLLLAALLALAAPIALATNTPTKAPDPSTTSAATATATATGTGGNASGGAGGAGGQSDATGGNAESTGGQSVLNNHYEQVRQAPTAYAPTVFPAIGCGRGVSLGGSSPVGGAAVAFNWSNKDCEAFAAHISLAQSFSAIGRDELSCAVLMHLPLAKEIWTVLPTCEVAPAAAVHLSAAPSNEGAGSAVAAPPPQPVVVTVMPATCPVSVSPPVAKVAKRTIPSRSPSTSAAPSCAKP